jgi:UDP-glucose 4-epimerase
MNFADKQVLITGGAGFLGSFLCEEMLKQGARVTVFDKLLQGTSRIEHLLQNPKFTLIEGDLVNFDNVLSIVSNTDFIWHLASNTNIPSGLSDTSLDLNNSVIATHNVLEAMKQVGVRYLAFPSSGAVYGEVHSGKRSESHGPTLPISLYGAGKVACEAFMSAYSHLFGVNAWIFRYGNVISNRISHGAIRDFILKLEANPEQLEVLGDGTQAKSYLLVEECIAGMQFIINHTSLKNTNGFCDVFNVGAPDETVVSEIAKIVIHEMKLDGCKIKYRGGERGWPGDQAKISLDISKVKKLGWLPNHSSTEAVRIAVKRMLTERSLAPQKIL